MEGCSRRLGRREAGHGQLHRPAPPSELTLPGRAVVLILLVVASLFANVGAAQASLPEGIVHHLPEIEEWVYRNGATNDPLPCGGVCSNLWTAEHESKPASNAAAELATELTELETGLSLWGSLAQLQKELGAVAIGKAPLRIGWHIDAGFPTGHDMWVEIKGPRAPDKQTCWRTRLKLAGEEIGFSYHTKAYSPGNDLYLVQCGGPSELVAQQARDQENPEGTACGLKGPPPAYGVWTRQEWWWNQCYEGFYHEKETFSKIIAFGYHQSPTFTIPAEWTGQHLEGEDTYNIETNGAVAPEGPSVRVAIEHALESSGPLREWLLWVLEGKSGSDPTGPTTEEDFGPGGPSAPEKPGCPASDPVNCATGNKFETQSDLRVGGRGPGLELARTYNSQLAAKQTSPGPFGYGWSAINTTRIDTDGSDPLGQPNGTATITEPDGSTVRFFFAGTHWVPASPLVQATLKTEGAGLETTFRYTLPDQTILHFGGVGGPTSVTDRYGNVETLKWSGPQLESVSDPAGRKLTFAYNGLGFVESVTDPMGHVVKYSYEGGNLASVTEPGEATARWQFKYDAKHELTSQTDGRGNVTKTEYDGLFRASAQSDPLGRSWKWSYGAGEPSTETTVTEPTGAVTVEHFDAAHLPLSVTRAYGTPQAQTTTNVYDARNLLAGHTDGNNHTVSYTYDEAGNRTSETDGLGHTTEWSFDDAHDVIATTSPRGERTTAERDSEGNVLKLSRPAPGGVTQATNYKYGTHGELEQTEDPLKRTWKYEYNASGDRTAEVDPEADKRTWGYNTDSQLTSMVSPNGHVAGAKEVKFTTTIERDAQGRVVAVTGPLKHETQYLHDANGNIEVIVDPEENKTTYTYDADNERVKVEEPNKTVTETGYDGDGQITSQTDGSKHTTKYVRNALEEVTEVIDPLARKMTEEYDAAGNVTASTDAAKRTTSYKYDPADQLTEVSYSDGKTPSAEYEYDADGDRTRMIDGTGTSTFTYDELGRLSEAKDGHGDASAYEYDLANEKSKVTYPNGKAVTRTFDNAGRLKSVTDWLGHATKFTYDADSSPKASSFPSGTGSEDTYAYDEADRTSEVKMARGSEVLASLVYTRNKDGGVTKATTKGLPGEEKPAFAYDENSRLAKGAGTVYKYDAADDPTALGAETYSYDPASELEKSVLKKATVNTYAYDEVGQRVKRSPASGSATSYGYDQAGNLLSVAKPKEGEAPAVEDSYGYDGDGLRASQTIAGVSSYMTWDMSEGMPLILSDGSSSYVYGPGGLPLEQVSSGGTATYFHHDQQGSTRMITSGSGVAEATMTYDAYGNQIGHTGTATVSLGFDGQYTGADTGLIYLRARDYDPATAQFLSVDPAASRTRERYAYAGDNPVNLVDPTGLEAIPVPAPVAAGCAAAPAACGAAAVGGADLWLGAKVFNAWAGEEGSDDEGEAEGKTKRAERESEVGCGDPPPGYNPKTWTKKPASRPSDPGENWYDPEGGEWRWHGPDKYHREGHWDYKGPGNSAPWENIYP